MDTPEQLPEKEPEDTEEDDNDLIVVETPLPKRVRPGTPDPRVRREPDRRIQRPS